MDYLAIKEFFKTQATANNWEFGHNTEHLSEKIGTSLKGKDNLILVMGEPRGRRKYNGNHFDLPNLSFFLLKKVSKGDYEKEDIVFQEGVDGLALVQAAMELQKENEAGILKNYDPNTVDYIMASLETKERLFGVYVTFACEDSINV